MGLDRKTRESVGMGMGLGDVLGGACEGTAIILGGMHSLGGWLYERSKSLSRELSLGSVVSATSIGWGLLRDGALGAVESTGSMIGMVTPRAADYGRKVLDALTFPPVGE